MLASAIKIYSLSLVCHHTMYLYIQIILRKQTASKLQGEKITFKLFKQPIFFISLVVISLSMFEPGSTMMDLIAPSLVLLGKERFVTKLLLQVVLQVQ